MVFVLGYDAVIYFEGKWTRLFKCPYKQVIKWVVGKGYVLTLD